MQRPKREKLQKYLKFDSGCTVFSKDAPRSIKDQLTKLDQLISRDIREGAKINFKIPYLIQRKVWSKNQRALANTENPQKCFKFDSGSTVYQSMSQNLLNINLTNFVECLQETLGKEENLVLRFLI